MTAEVFRRRCEGGGDVFNGLLSSGKGAVVLLTSGGAVSAGERPFLPVLGGTRDRGEVSFFCAPVPARGGDVPFLALDRLFPDEIEPEEDARLLLTAASLLSPLFTGTSRGEEAPARRRAPGSSLGRTLQRHIAAWIEPMENTRRLRSDVHERLVGEVEKILIAAALEKTGYVQTEAALFLGINRNTLAKKIRRYGLGKKGA
jgi:DNA-binding protein Fis